VGFAELLCCAPAVLLVVYTVVDALVIQPARARGVLARWTAQRSWALQEAAHRWGSGPFGVAVLDSRVVFRIVIVDQHGRRHDGFARAGYRWLGLFRQDVDVIWVGGPGPSPSASPDRP
jgi:hypothetical protein